MQPRASQKQTCQLTRPTRDVSKFHNFLRENSIRPNSPGFMTMRNTTQALRYSEFGDPGSWQTFANLSESHIYPAPVSLDDEQAAIFWIQGDTAWRMLNDFADLRAGDWIIQNDGRAHSDPVRRYSRHQNGELSS